MAILKAKNRRIRKAKALMRKVWETSPGTLEYLSVGKKFSHHIKTHRRRLNSFVNRNSPL